MAVAKLGSVLVCCGLPARLWLNLFAPILSVKWGLTVFATEGCFGKYVGILGCFSVLAAES